MRPDALRVASGSRASQRTFTALLTLLVHCAPTTPATTPVPLPQAEPRAEPLNGDSADEAEAPTTVPSQAQSSSPAPATAPIPAPEPIPLAAAKAAKLGSAPDTLVAELLGGGGLALKAVLANPEKHRFQVLYGVIASTATAKTNPGSAPIPKLIRHGFRTEAAGKPGGAEYFFPASSMKVPIALASCERLPSMRALAPSLGRDSALRIFPVSGSESPYITTLARETWRALIVSDNASANRLLGFVGLREANETIWALGLSSARIRTGFATGADASPPEVSPRLEVVAPSGAIQEIPSRKSTLELPPTKARGLDLGVAAIVDGQKTPGPMSFATKNAMALGELQDSLVRIVRPELLPNAKTGKAPAEDLAYLRQALSTPPSKSGIPGYDRNVVADYQLDPFLRGIERVRSRSLVEVYAKVGQAYGFVTVNAYVVEKATGKAFFLIATVYANPNEIMNDDKYAYDDIAFPALADVAEVITKHAFTP